MRAAHQIDRGPLRRGLDAALDAVDPGPGRVDQGAAGARDLAAVLLEADLPQPAAVAAALRAARAEEARGAAHLGAELDRAGDDGARQQGVVGLPVLVAEDRPQVACRQSESSEWLMPIEKKVGKIRKRI